jgi:hypothetical protein
MRATVTTGTWKIGGPPLESTIPAHYPEGIPVPRLEFRWVEARRPNRDNWDWYCHYVLVLPIRETDYRRVSRDAPKITGILFSTSKISGGPNHGNPVHEDGTIETPLNDGMNAVYDAAVLHLPVYASCDGKYHKVR